MPPENGRARSSATCSKHSKPGEGALAQLEALSPTRLRVEFTPRAELYEKLEKARELLSRQRPTFLGLAPTEALA